MLNLLCARLRPIHRDNRGVAFVEFGFLMPILAVFVLAIIDISMGFSQRFAMQQAVNRGLELLLVRPPTAADNAADVNYDGIRQEVATAAGVPLASVVARRFLLCNGAAPASATATSCPVGQQQAKYLQLTVNKSFTGRFWVGTVAMSATGSLRLS